jgi:hypothetical protein
MSWRCRLMLCFSVRVWSPCLYIPPTHRKGEFKRWCVWETVCSGQNPWKHRTIWRQPGANRQVAPVQQVPCQTEVEEECHLQLRLLNKLEFCVCVCVGGGIWPNKSKLRGSKPSPWETPSTLSQIKCVVPTFPNNNNNQKNKNRDTWSLSLCLVACPFMTRTSAEPVGKDTSPWDWVLLLTFMWRAFCHATPVALSLVHVSCVNWEELTWEWEWGLSKGGSSHVGSAWVWILTWPWWGTYKEPAQWRCVLSCGSGYSVWCNFSFKMEVSEAARCEPGSGEFSGPIPLLLGGGTQPLTAAGRWWGLVYIPRPTLPTPQTNRLSWTSGHFPLGLKGSVPCFWGSFRLCDSMAAIEQWVVVSSFPGRPRVCVFAFLFYFI